MQVTVDKVALEKTIVDVVMLFVQPYHELVEHLAREGRLDQEDVDQLHATVREAAGKVSEIVTKGLRADRG
ncbi:MAG: hypothetical protein F4137_10920 [Acidobacteria bacterium]|nr:hypothetical protein [Acidobacteriota bacterium]MYH29343.1 hypothetical protein [Acidobacteriota bacterium]